MRTHTLLLGLALLLAGCLGSDDGGSDELAAGDEHADPDTTDHDTDQGAGQGDAADDGTSGHDADTDDGSGGGAAGADDTDTDDGADAAPNTPPTADIKADVTTGGAPFDVNFTLDGSDLDGDALSWTFDADGDGTPDTEGTSLPFNFTYSYTDVGNYTATLTVTDGAAQVNQTLDIEASAPDAPEAGSDVEFPDDPACQTQTEGVTEVPGGFYVTDDPLPYLYEEANGVPGLQRDPGDAAAAHPCQNPDIYHF